MKTSSADYSLRISDDHKETTDESKGINIKTSTLYESSTISNDHKDATYKTKGIKMKTSTANESSTISDDHKEITDKTINNILFVGDKENEVLELSTTSNLSTLVSCSEFIVNMNNKSLKDITKGLKLNYQKDIFSIKSNMWELLRFKFEIMEYHLEGPCKWICDECITFWIEMYVTLVQQ